MAGIFDRNPFAVLGASTCDDVHRLAQLADDAALFGDDGAEEAFDALTHSMRRLDAELRWMPGETAKTAREIMAYSKRKEPSPYPDLSGMSAMAKFSACRALLETWIVDDTQSALALVSSLSAAWDGVHAQDVMEQLNAERSRAGVPLIAEIEEVYDRIDALLSQVADDLLARAEKAGVSACAIAGGAAERYAATRGRLPEALVNAYAAAAAQEESELRKSLCETCAQILNCKLAQKGALLGEKIAPELARWSETTRPMRMLLAAKGREDTRVFELYRELYRAASHLNNACSQHRLCAKLFRRYDEVFFDLPSVKEHLQKNLAIVESVAR